MTEKLERIVCDCVRKIHGRERGREGGGERGRGGGGEREREMG